MRQTEAHHSATPIVNAFIPSNFQTKYLEKIKAMSSSKSLKGIPTALSNESPFKKTEKKLEMSRNQKQIGMISAIPEQRASQSKLGNKPIKSNNLQSNKIINRGPEHLTPNPEQFLVRTQLFEKQKELKLQFERRKQLYGVTVDLKLKANPHKVENEEIDEQGAEMEHAEKSKSYKEMYFKKYGKSKFQESNKHKKKTKNYEELMKESIARFNEKFKQLGTVQPSFHKKEAKSEGMKRFQNNQESFSSKATKTAQDMTAVEEKIKSLMQKLHLEEQMSMSIESIEQLSRISIEDDEKESEINSSNVFQKMYQDVNVNDSSRDGMTIDNQNYEIGSIIDQNTLAQQEENQYPKEQILASDDHLNEKTLVAEERQVYNEKTDKEQPIETERAQQLYDQPIHKVLEQNQQENTTKVVPNQVLNKEVDLDLPLEDLIISEQTPNLDISMQKMNFYSIEHPKIQLLFQKILPQCSGDQLPKLSLKQLSKEVSQVQKKQEVTPFAEKQQLNHKPIQSISQSPKEILQSSNQELPVLDKGETFQEEQLPQECTFELSRQSFIDMNGNTFEDVQIQVMNFGFCRLLVVAEESESQQSNN